MTPASFENAIRTSYASLATSVFCSQCAASVPSSSRTTEGTSAQFTNQSVPDAAVRGSDQPDAVRCANFNSDVWPCVSIQLTMAESPVTVSCGARLGWTAASASGSSFSATGRRAVDLEHAA